MSKAKTNEALAVTDEQIVASLAVGNNAPAFRAYFGPAEYVELHDLARRALKHRNTGGQRIYLLPGIMGSALGYRKKSGDHPIWLNPTAIESGELLSLALPESKALQPLSVMLPGYLKLKLQLQLGGFDVAFHPFDWRKSVVHSGKLLLQRILSERKKSVAIVAHSMGGLVARAALAEDKRGRIGKVVQLGTPNFGSFAAVQALRAVYGSVRKVASLDPHHSAEQLSRHVFRSLPGIYEMLPAAEHVRDSDLLDLKSWPEDLLGPDATLLAQTRRVRERLSVARENCYHIVGVNRETIVGVAKRRGGFEYSLALDGDGTVPRALAEWSGAQHYFVDELHGKLTDNDAVAAAIVDLLKEGTTKKIRKEWSAPKREIVRTTRDADLRRELRGKVKWDQLSFEQRRKILEPTVSADFPGLFVRK